MSTLMRFPQVYNNRSSLTTTTFWKNAVLTAVVDAAICFFLPYYAEAARGKNNANDLYSVGHTAYTAMLGTVTLEVSDLILTPPPPLPLPQGNFSHQDFLCEYAYL